jgi:hypothetical protein
MLSVYLLKNQVADRLTNIVPPIIMPVLAPINIKYSHLIANCLKNSVSFI